MKTIIISILALLVFLLACQKSVVQSLDTTKANTQETLQEKTPVSESTTDDLENLLNERSTPIAIRDCLPKVKVDEPFEFDLSMNPFYLRTDLDGNRVVDYAMVIRGKKTKKLGLLICKDAKEPLIFGELAKPKIPLTDMENDNFIGSHWEIITNKEAREWYSNVPNEENKKLANAKGEILSFSYEIDGLIYIYWDGKAFRTITQ